MLGTLKMLGTELRKCVLYTLYTWMATHHSFLVASFADFLTFCHSFSINQRFSCILPVY
jgi:hypothetical protein